MTREICEAYMGITPSDVANMTLDQICVLMTPKKWLKEGRRTETISLTEAKLRGLVK